MKISKNNFLFLLILISYKIVINKSSNYYEFKNPQNEEIFRITNFEYVFFNGEIEIIDGDNFEFYCYSSSEDIKEDNNGHFINYSYFQNNLHPGSVIDIKSSSSYIIIKGTGYISFGANKITSINTNNIQKLELPYDLNNKYYQLDGKGNALEIVIDNGNICIYLNNICYNTNNIINNISGKQIVNIRNINNAKGSIIKFLYTSRKETYTIDQGKGDKIYCLLKNQYKFIVKEDLAKQYYKLKEGILKITGNPHVEFNKAKFISDDNGLYYFSPESDIIEIYLNNINEGEISAAGINPTIEMKFPSSIITQINQNIGPQYLRIEIFDRFDYYNEEYIFEFGNSVEIFEGKMFKNGDLNKGLFSSNMTINKNHAGKTYTVVYNNSGTFTYKKIYNWIILKEYEIMPTYLEPANEMTFKYIQNKTKNTLVHLERGYSSNYVKIYIYTNEEDIRYNATARLYSNYYKVYNSWKEIEIDKSTFYLIIHTKEYGYSDYISFRNENILVKNEVPQVFKGFNEMNYIGYILDLEDGNNNIEILTNIPKTFTISLYQGEYEKEICQEYSCQFKVKKETNKKYYIFIKNLNSKVKDKNKELYILQYKELDYYTISNNGFSQKYFLLPFECKFKLSSNILSNLQLSKELNLNYRYPLENKYNVTININIVNNNFKLTSEKIDNYNYDHYYINLNENIISEVIISVTGNWSVDLLLPYENIAFAYGGPFYIYFPGNQPQKINNYLGNLIYFTIINNNIDSSKNYLFSIPEGTIFLKGKLFEENGELNNKYKSTRKYMFDYELFENDSELTFEFKNQINGEIYYNLLNEKIILNKYYSDYKTYELDFKNNNNIYYLGIYNESIETYGYVDNEDNKITISYKDDNSNLNPVLPNDNYDKLNDFFFPLNTKNNLIKFSWKNENINKDIKEFTIFNPNLTEESLDCSKQSKFFLKKNKEKIIKLDKNNIKQSDIYRVVTRSLNKMVDLTFNSKNTYILNAANRYTNIWEISKNEELLYKAFSSSDTLLFSKVLEGSIYKVLQLNNATTVVEKSNNFLIKIESFKNVGYIDIIIKNKNKIKFYYIFYSFNKNENELRRLILPIFNTNSTEVNFKFESDTINISKLNPIYDQQYKEKYNDLYLAISYEQDFENPNENTNEIKLIYNKIKNGKYSYLNDSIPHYINSYNYNSKYILKRKQFSNLVLNFITYDDIDIKSNITFFEGIGLLKTIYLDKKYIQIVIDKENIIDDLDIEYNIEFILLMRPSKNACIQFCFDFTNNIADINEFQNITNKLNITIKDNKISWEKLNNIKDYEIYINNHPNSTISLFSNDCYLRDLKKGISSDTKIINIKKNSYEFEKKTQSLIVTVVALENKYGMRIVYNPIKYYYHYEKKHTLLIILLTCFSIVFIVVIFVCYYVYSKKEESTPSKPINDYSISMVSFDNSAPIATCQ